MKVVLVDDEPFALEYLEKLLNHIEGVYVIGKFTNPFEAKRYILKEKPMVVFLDIEMPEMTGIELAEDILSSIPETHIVFGTAFNDYAVKAFELNAVDYLVKPFQQKRINETLQRLKRNINNESPSIPIERVDRICVFQSLSFTRSEETTEVLNVKWRTTKARAIFSYLLQHRRKLISKEKLLDIFWPEMDLQKGIPQLYSTIYQIRKTLSSIQFNVTISNHENGYRLYLNDVKLDSNEWEDGLKTNTIVNEESFELHKHLLTIYQGDYLSEEDYIWAENERERLRILWAEHVTKVADYLASNSEYGEAISLYLQMQSSFPHLDHSYFKLMKLYSIARNLHAVEQQYILLKKMLAEEYGIEPRSAIQNWYKNWLKTVAVED